MTERTNYGWIEWAGGECPIDRATKVCVKMRSGKIDEGFSAGWWMSWAGTHDHWLHDGGNKDIIAYRVVAA